MVVEAQGSDGPAAQLALGELCQSYWYPLYSFARRSGLTSQDAEDGTQAFFQHLLEKDTLDSVDRERGKLRAFLLASMRNFLRQQWRNQHTQKRGGEAVQLSIDAPWAEERILQEPASNEAPELYFDRHWAHALLSRVFDRLEAYYDQAGSRQRYEAIKGCLQGDGRYEAGDQLAASLDITPAALRSSVFKLRGRFREYVEEEIHHTCATEEEARGEMMYLCQILSTQ